MKTPKKITLPKERIPKSTRPNQVHRCAKDYDRKDDGWKKSEET